MNRKLSIGMLCVIAVAALMALTGCPKPTPAPTPTMVPPTATLPPSPTPLPTPTASPTPLPLADWVAEGDEALVRSDFATAEKAYRRAIEADPEYAPAHVGLAWMYGWQAGKSRDALDEAQRAAELDPRSASAWAALSEARRWRGDTPGALEAAEKAAQLDPKGSQAQAVLARAYLADRQYDAAVRAAEESVKVDPQSAFAYNTLARVHDGMSDFGRARAAREQTITLEPQFGPWHWLLGELLVRLQHYDAADEQFEQALQLVPDDPAAMLGQARVHSSRQEYVEAERLISEAAAAAPQATEPLLDWGYLYLEQSEPEKAAAKFAEAARLDAGDFWIEDARARVRMDEGDCESAAATYQDLSSDHPREGSLRLSSAVAKWCLGDVNRALELARQVTVMEPYNADAYWMLATLYTSQDRWDEALEAYVKAARYSPVAAGAHSGLGDVYIGQGDLDALEAEAGITARLDPNDERGFTGLCLAYWNKNEPEKMLTPCEKAAELDPQNADDLGRWGAALVVNGRFQEAIDVLSRSAVDNPEHPLTRLYLGIANLRTKQYPAAKKEFETYQRLTGVDDTRLNWLVSSLDQGWELREAKGLEYLVETAKALGSPATWKIESANPPTRTLTATLKAEADEEPEATYRAAVNLLEAACFLLPRTEPLIDGGTMVRATDAAGKPLFTLEVETSDQWNYLTFELTEEQFVERVDFVQPAGGKPSPEMTDKLVKTTGDDVAKLRGLDAKEAIPFERLKQSELVEHLKASIDEEDRDQARSDQLLLTLLGALDPEVDLLEAEEGLMGEQTLGFYDPDDETFHVVQDKAPGLTDRMTAAHEYVHALQDQYFEIGKARDQEKNDDRGIAYDALVEGDATLATVLYTSEKLPALEMLQTIEASEAEADMEQLAKSPSVLRGWLEFPYSHGMAFVQPVYETGGWEAVNDLYAKPPASTEQVLHPERYRAGEMPVEVALPDLSNTLGAEWKVIYENVLGELTWRLVLNELVGPASAERAADGWGGDRYVLLRQGDEGPGAVLMRAAWDTPEDAEEFWAVIRAGLAGRPEFNEVVHELTGSGHTRYFQGPEVFWIVNLDGANVTLAIGPTEEAAAKLNDLAE
jgi:tetratricopeptide (TPR) repeat protein